MGSTLPDLSCGSKSNIDKPVVPKLTLGYIRVSTDRQDLSLEAQRASIRQAAEYHQSGELSIFGDPDTSGSTPFAEREQGSGVLKRAQEAVAAGTQVTLIVPKVDRLGRNVIDINQTVRVFEQLGVRIIFLDINVDTRTAMGRAFMQIAAVFAELELARIRERILAALDQKRAKGYVIGTVPFGWDAVETGEITAKGVKIRKLADNPVEQKWILQMAAWRQAGWSYDSIARELNRNGVPTKRSGELLKLRDACNSTSIRPSCGRWQAGNVAKVLSNQSVQRWLKTYEFTNHQR